MGDETEGFIGRCIAGAFPGGGARLLGTEAIPFGSNELWRLRVEHGGAAMELVLRRYRHWITWHSSDDRLKAAREARAIEHVRGYGLRAPALYGHGPDWTLVAWVSGQRMTPGGARATVDAHAARSLAGVLAQLHRLPPPDGPFPRVTVAASLLAIRAWATALGDARLSAAIERLRPLAEEAPVFIHGDPNPSNVLLDGDFGVAGLIDWEDAAIADYRFDIVTAYWALLLRAPDVAGDFIAAYESASGRPVRDLPQWLAFATVRAWAVAGILRASGAALTLFSTDEEKAAAERRLDEAGF